MVGKKEKSIFAKIIDEEIKGWKVYEDSTACAFLDAYPVTEGHIIVASKTSKEDIFDLKDDEFLHLAGIARKIAISMKKKLKADFVNILTAESVIKHAFLHVVPRYEHDLMGVVPDMENKRQIEKERMDELQRDIRGGLGASKKV